MKIFNFIIFCFLLNNCRTPIKETESFEFYLQLDDATTLIVHDKFLDEYYSYHNFQENPIDIYSLKNESSFMLDKNMVFSKYEISDCCLIIPAKEIDRSSFIAFENSIYGKDKGFVYDCRHGKIDEADVETFEPLIIETEKAIAYGKDKNNYFFWDKVVADIARFSELYRAWKVRTLSSK
ncbi:DKNYY domain-containing protein [Flammeovirga aprica]|uniref:Uncharacterized protein n=1 Tax=Flammeovirga aprica JL-4 TaxID=694437 RepID=A0A7X9RT35_9BACT|nr:DKNYY domain-containing protein [Flammeovirga aprica]NME67995.1 hypothetical protein [Flammeovirga aprica JL-4]